MRFGNWKAIREPMLTGKVQLFDLAKDLKEEKDLAAEKPKLAKKAIALMDEAHVNDPRWQVRPGNENQ